MSVLDSETPYREMHDKPPAAASFATADSKLLSAKSQLDQPRLRSIREDVEKENHRISEMIYQQDEATE